MASSSVNALRPQIPNKRQHDQTIQYSHPDKAINPTPAEIDKGMSRNQRASMPPLRAKGTPVNISNPSRKFPNME